MVAGGAESDGQPGSGGDQPDGRGGRPKKIETTSVVRFLTLGRCLEWSGTSEMSVMLNAADGVDCAMEVESVRS